MPYKGPNGIPLSMKRTARASHPSRLCPACGTAVRLGTRPFSYEGVHLGTFEVHECPQCGEWSFTPSGSRAIDRALKAHGLFGAHPEAEVPSHPLPHPRPSKVHA
jgi:ribosomal protein S27AE